MTGSARALGAAGRIGAVSGRSSRQKQMEGGLACVGTRRDPPKFVQNVIKRDMHWGIEQRKVWEGKERGMGLCESARIDALSSN